MTSSSAGRENGGESRGLDLGYIMRFGGCLGSEAFTELLVLVSDV